MSTQLTRVQYDLSGMAGMFLGVRDRQSITTECMLAAHRAGMKVGIVCQTITPEIEDIAKECGINININEDDEEEKKKVRLAQCNVLNYEEYEPALQKVVTGLGGEVDLLFHGIAFAPNRILSSVFNARWGVDGKMGDFDKMMNISVGSLLCAVQCIRENLRPDSRILTLSYGDKHMRGYNGMDMAKRALEALVRTLSVELAEIATVNAISPGPIDTTAANGIPAFKGIKQDTLDHAPLHRLPTHEEVAHAALHLMTATGITGTTHFVDCGRHAVQ